MVDAIKNERLVVRNEGGTAPYLLVAESQLAEVRQVLDQHGIEHWVNPVYLIFEGEPTIRHVHFRRNADVSRVQSILDAIS